MSRTDRPRIRWSPWWPRLLVAATVLAAPALGRTEVLDFSATTLLAGRSDPRDGKVYSVVPAYQLISLVASDLKLRFVDDLKLVVSGWGGQTPANPLKQGEAVAGDLDVAFVEGKLLWRRVELRAGRQLVFRGAFRAYPLDGLAATIHIYKGLGVTGYAGSPVVPRFARAWADTVFGARLFYRHSYNSEVSASFIQAHDKGRLERRDLALDARWLFHRTLWAQAYGQLSLIELRLVEADVAVSWQPKTWVEVAVDYRRTAPDMFLSRSSIFAVFSEESRDEAGARFFLEPVPRLRILGDYHLVRNEAGLGHRAMLRGQATFGYDYLTTLGLEGRAFNLPQNTYVQGRLFASHHFLPRLFGSLDGDLYYFLKDVNGQRLSVTGAASLGYDFADGWRAVVTAIGDVTPQVQGRFEFIARLAYNGTIRLREVRP